MDELTTHDHNKIYLLICLLMSYFVIGGLASQINVVVNTNTTLNCPLSEDTVTAKWVDANTGYKIVSFNYQTPEIETVFDQAKYNNFLFSYNRTTQSLLLIILNAEVEDGGEYECLEYGANSTVVTTARYNLRVGVPPFCDLGTSYYDDCSAVRLTCNCTGASPGDQLTFSFFGGTGDLIQSQNSSNTAVYYGVVPNVDLTFGCRGMHDGSNSYSSTTTSCAIMSPFCKLRTSYFDDCSAVTLICDCSGSSPLYQYNFFRGNGELIQVHNLSDATIYYDVKADVELTFGCRGYNEMHSGNNSYSSITSSCSIASTVSKRRTWLIVCSSVTAVVIIIILLAVVIYKGGSPSENIFRMTKPTEDGHVRQEYIDLKPFTSREIPEQNVRFLSLVKKTENLKYYKAIMLNSQEVMVKSPTEETNDRVSKLLRREIQEALTLQQQENIVNIIGWCSTEPRYAIYEYVMGGNLSDTLTEEFNDYDRNSYANIKKKGTPTVAKRNYNQLTNYAFQVANGLNFLAENGFLHPGLRAKKVLMDVSGRCKLYDFVFAKNAKEWTTALWTTDVPFQWMPPEFLLHGHISTAGDVWSFGVLLWEIFSFGIEPYTGKDITYVEKTLSQNILLNIPENCPSEIWQLMLTCWEDTIDKRTIINDITVGLARMCCPGDMLYEEV